MTAAAATADAAIAAPFAATCRHCGLSAPAGRDFCCPGCEAAFQTIEGLGLGRYYAQRVLDAGARAPRPVEEAPRDFDRFIVAENGTNRLTLAVDGLQCGACVWLIESVLARQAGLQTGRVNMTTRRLRLAWQGDRALAARFVASIERLGYRLVPFDERALAAATDQTSRKLIRALAVAGFAAGNVMLLSIGTWAGLTQGMGPATRELMHWVSALIALPAIAYAGMPFFASAAGALRHGRTNMDVPISVGVVLVSGISIMESMRGGLHTYFDSAITLLFFLLIGRVLDHHARGQVRATAEQLLALRASDVTVLLPGGATARRNQDSVAEGERVLVGAGERIGVDGVLERGPASLDTSLITGESVPLVAQAGARVFAGTVNLGDALVVRAEAAGESTLLAECVRLIEAAEARRSRFVVLADRVARAYAPAVHLCALLTFLLWVFVWHESVADSLLTASAVLIITCPCALALAIPAVQVIATGGLFRRGILLKSATALERLARVDTVVFDKTGTLTRPALTLAADDADGLALAAGMAASSLHPLARALAAAVDDARALEGVVEHHGQGLSVMLAEGEARLGSGAFCGVPAPGAAEGPELWLARPGRPPLRFRFAETLRPDAGATIARLRAMRMRVLILSGDGAAAVSAVSAALGVEEAVAGCTPVEKVARIEALRAAGRHVLMVGDGLNDSPSLAAADVSASPASAADLSQTVADAVFQGEGLAPVAALLVTARLSAGVMRQNLGLALAYNALMLPLAVIGWVTPWLAAIAMSSSSLLVMANSLRLRRGEGR